MATENKSTLEVIKNPNDSPKYEEAYEVAFAEALKRYLFFNIDEESLSSMRLLADSIFKNADHPLHGKILATINNRNKMIEFLKEVKNFEVSKRACETMAREVSRIQIDNEMQGYVMQLQQDQLKKLENCLNKLEITQEDIEKIKRCNIPQFVSDQKRQISILKNYLNI